MLSDLLCLEKLQNKITAKIAIMIFDVLMIDRIMLFFLELD